MALALVQQRELILELSIAGEPIPKMRPRVTRGRTYTPRHSLENELAIEWLMKAQIRTPVRGEIVLDVDFFRSTKRRADLDNLLKQILDAGNGVVWVDDSQIIGLHAFKHLDCDAPRTELRVWKT